MKKIFSLAIFVLLMAIAICYAHDKSYYAFYPSAKGNEYKEFRHNIFGFSIDMPSIWTFGVVNKDNLPVVLLYPDGLDTGKFTDSYETMEIGLIPERSISLEEAQKYVLDGMKAGHAGYKILKEPHATRFSEQAGRAFIALWVSKTGFSIYEYISLIPYKDQIRTICVRTTFNPQKNLKLYDDIINSYKAFDQMEKF
ncbi:MAG: hypothetical protein PHC54_06675 [Candidatus Omnitrophica bacterium]|nr:hypothetical protein [Candidatus Omnitrophota bacterium]